MGSIDGRVSYLGFGWGASAGATVHIPIGDFPDLLLTGSYGLAKVEKLVIAGQNEYRVTQLAAGIGRRHDTWEWRGVLGAFYRDDVDDESDQGWYPMLEITFSMNFPRPPPTPTLPPAGGG